MLLLELGLLERLELELEFELELELPELRLELPLLPLELEPEEEEREVLEAPDEEGGEDEAEAGPDMDYLSPSSVSEESASNSEANVERILKMLNFHVNLVANSLTRHWDPRLR